MLFSLPQHPTPLIYPTPRPLPRNAPLVLVPRVPLACSLLQIPTLKLQGAKPKPPSSPPRLPEPELLHVHDTPDLSPGPLPRAADGAHAVCVPRALSHTGHLASLVHPPHTNTLVLGTRGVKTEAGPGFPTGDPYLHASWDTSPWHSWRRATPSETHPRPGQCLGEKERNVVRDQLMEGVPGASARHPHLCGRGESGRLMSAAQTLLGRGCSRPRRCGSPWAPGTGHPTPPHCSQQTAG